MLDILHLSQWLPVDIVQHGIKFVSMLWKWTHFEEHLHLHLKLCVIQMVDYAPFCLPVKNGFAMPKAKALNTKYSCHYHHHQLSLVTIMTTYFFPLKSDLAQWLATSFIFLGLQNGTGYSHRHGANSGRKHPYSHRRIQSFASFLTCDYLTKVVLQS
jgi:hypothetical protein